MPEHPQEPGAENVFGRAQEEATRAVADQISLLSEGVVPGLKEEGRELTPEHKLYALVVSERTELEKLITPEFIDKAYAQVAINIQQEPDIERGIKGLSDLRASNLWQKLSPERQKNLSGHLASVDLSAICEAIKENLQQGQSLEGPARAAINRFSDLSSLNLWPKIHSETRENLEYHLNTAVINNAVDAFKAEVEDGQTNNIVAWWAINDLGAFRASPVIWEKVEHEIEEAVANFMTPEFITGACNRGKEYILKGKEFIPIASDGLSVLAALARLEPFLKERAEAVEAKVVFKRSRQTDDKAVPSMPPTLNF